MTEQTPDPELAFKYLRQKYGIPQMDAFETELLEKQHAFKAHFGRQMTSQDQFEIVFFLLKKHYPIEFPAKQDG